MITAVRERVVLAGPETTAPMPKLPVGPLSDPEPKGRHRPAVGRPSVYDLGIEKHRREWPAGAIVALLVAVFLLLAVVIFVGIHATEPEPVVPEIRSTLLPAWTLPGVK